MAVNTKHNNKKREIQSNANILRAKDPQTRINIYTQTIDNIAAVSKCNANRQQMTTQSVAATRQNVSRAKP
jgi:hypothetical protein